MSAQTRTASKIQLFVCCRFRLEIVYDIFIMMCENVAICSMSISIDRLISHFHIYTQADFLIKFIVNVIFIFYFIFFT